MKKKLLCVSIVSLSLTAAILVGANTSQFVFAGGFANLAQWVHYAQLDPTEESKGIREYWVQCGGGYQFTEPDCDNIIEGSVYDTSEFAVDDDRWIPNEVDCDASYWYGKKWVALGTSITATSDTNNDGVITGQYPNTLEELSGLAQSNFAFEGANMGGHPFLVSLRSNYRSAIKNADLITIEGGINDWYAGRPLGNVNDTMPYYNDWTKGGINLITGHSSGTFAGSCYSLFTNLKNLNPTATIVALTDCSGPDGGICASDRANSKGLYLSDYNDMMEDIAEAVGIKFIDVGGECGITGADSQYFTDHVHLNADGGEIYANYIWDTLLTYTKKVHDDRDSVTVTFKTNGETINTQTFEKGGSAYSPYPGTYEKRDFLYWDSSLKNITEDTVINSVWTDNKITLSFDTDGGSAIADIVDFAGASIDEIEAPTKEGYVFDGWNPALPSVMPNSDLEVTALWREEDNLFSRLDESKGKMMMMDGSGNPYEFSESGHNLSDYIAVNGRSLLIEFDVNTVRNVAQYSTASLNIIPHYNTEGSAPQYSIYYESYSASNAYMTVTRNENHYQIMWEGYNYIRIAYQNYNVSNLSVKYAAYTLTFSDGENIISSQNVVSGESISAPDAPTKDGYIFDGWDKVVPSVMPNNDLTLTALWREEDDLLSRLDEEKGKRLTYSSGNPVVTNNSARNLSDYIPVNGKKIVIEFDVYTVRNANDYSGGSFNICPFSNTGGSAPSYSIFWESYSGANSSLTITKTDNHYRIIWNAANNYIRIAYEKANVYNLTVKYQKFTVTFSDGENIIDTQSVIYGESAIAPDTPTKEGYIFDGWDKTFTNITADKTVTAKWKDEDELYDSTQALQNTFLNSTANGTLNGYVTSNYFACNRNNSLRIVLLRSGANLGDFRVALGASNNDSYLGTWQFGSSSTSVLKEDGTYSVYHLTMVRETVGSYTYFTLTNTNPDMHYVRLSYQKSAISSVSVKAA